MQKLNFNYYIKDVFKYYIKHKMFEIYLYTYWIFQLESTWCLSLNMLADNKDKCIATCVDYWFLPIRLVYLDGNIIVLCYLAKVSILQIHCKILCAKV